MAFLTSPDPVWNAEDYYDDYEINGEPEQLENEENQTEKEESQSEKNGL